MYPATFLCFLDLLVFIDNALPPQAFADKHIIALQVDWESSPSVAKLQIRGEGGEVLLEESLSLDTCRVLK